MLALLLFISFVYPYVYLPKFTSSTKFFNLDKINNDDFGLRQKYTWYDIIPYLNANTKLFFIQRHGQAVNNIAQKGFSEAEFKCYYQTLENDSGLLDAQLTKRGELEVKKLVLRIKNLGFLPDKFYVSPLYRAIQTWQLTWLSLTDLYPTVKEKLRETTGINVSSKRQNKSKIKSQFPEIDMKFEPTFTEVDNTWRSYRKETKRMRNLRAARLMNEIFSDSKDMKIISLVTHAGLINSILHVVNHEKITLRTGEIVAVIVKRHKYDKVKYISDRDLKWEYFKQICPEYPEYLPPPNPKLYNTN